LLFWSSGSAADPCPCKYKLSGLSHVTSASPIPPAHALCLASISELIEWIQKTEKTLDSGGLSKLMFQSTFRGLSTLDWGVPPIADAQEMLTHAEKRIAERKNGPDTVKKETAPDKQAGKSKKGFEAELEAELARLEEDARVNEEAAARTDDATAVYAKCVIANNLPPTAK